MRPENPDQESSLKLEASPENPKPSERSRFRSLIEKVVAGIAAATFGVIPPVIPNSNPGPAGTDYAQRLVAPQPRRKGEGKLYFADAFPRQDIGSLAVHSSHSSHASHASHYSGSTAPVDSSRKQETPIPPEQVTSPAVPTPPPSDSVSGTVSGTSPEEDTFKTVHLRIKSISKSKKTIKAIDSLKVDHSFSWNVATTVLYLDTVRNIGDLLPGDEVMLTFEDRGKVPPVLRIVILSRSEPAKQRK